MNSFLVVAVGVGVIILCSGVVRCATMYMKSRYGTAGERLRKRMSSSSGWMKWTSVYMTSSTS